MPQYKIDLTQSKIVTLSVQFSAYEAGSAVFKLAPTIPANEIRRLISQLVNGCKKPISILPGDIIILHDVSALRFVIEYLIKENYIDINDQPNIFGLLKIVEQTLEQREKLALEHKSAQKDTLENVSDIYVEDIIAQCNDYQTAITLLKHAFYRLHLNINRHKVIKYLEDNKVDLSVVDSILALWKICNGQANLETTHIRLGNQLPNLLNQRNILFNNCIGKLKAKFPNLDDENNLYMIVGLELYRNSDQELPPFEDTQKLIANALSEATPSRITQMVFKQEVLPVVTRAFSIMGILAVQKEPDFARIEALRQKFNSPVLKKYQDDYHASKLYREAEKTNRLLLALNTKNPEQVRTVLAQGGINVNQVFSNGLTPLIMAAYCSPDMIRVLLRFEPDIHQMNKYNTFTALGAAISQSSEESVKLLLEARACIFKPCGVVNYKSPIFVATPQLQHAFPLTWALEIYTRNKTPESRAVVKLILQWGGGMSFGDTHPSPSDLIEFLAEDIVVLGSKVPQGLKIEPIQNSKQFIERIKPENYTHWQCVFDQYTNSFPLGSASIYINEIRKHILDYKRANKVSYVHNINSPITVSGDSHEELIKRIKPIVESKPDLFGIFLTLIQARNYSKALRCACTSLNPQALHLLKILLEYKDKLNVGINEKAGDKQQTALHHAALKGNRDAYDTLIAAGAKEELTDKDGIRADVYLARHEKSTHLSL